MDEEYQMNPIRPSTRSRTARPSIHAFLPSVQAMHGLGGTTMARRRSRKVKVTPINQQDNGVSETSVELDGENGEIMTVSAGIFQQQRGSGDKETMDEMTVKDIAAIKELPCTMDEKRQIRKYLLEKGGQSSATGRRVTQSSALHKFSDYTLEMLYGLRLWEKPIYEIEGRFGSAVRSYFAFLRFLFYVNLGIFFLIFFFMVVPMILYTGYGDESLSSNVTDCNYEPYDPNSINSFVQYVTWWFTGKGFMEKTYLFMGYYANTLELASGVYYNIPLAYTLVTFLYLLFSLGAIVSRAARGLRETVTSDEDRFYSYCNKIFAGWDYCINDADAADIKHQSIFNIIRADIAEERLFAERAGRTTEQKVKLYLKRILINIFVLCLLAGAFVAIFYTADYAIANSGKPNDSYFLELLITYMVSIVITFVNFIAPIIFNQLIIKEEYSPDFTIKFTLLRTVLLRLVSIVFLYVVVYIQVNCPDAEKVQVGTVCEHCDNVQCWETYMGQEMYKLTILDFFVVISFTLFVEFPRKLVATSCTCSLAKKIEVQEFNLPAKVLDIVYAQTICWIGSFYSPLLPGIVVIKFFIFFYLQKLSLVYNCQPSKKPFRASRTGTFFFLILLLGFLVAIVPIVVGISVLKPSGACGPYRGENRMWDIIIQSIMTYSEPVQKMFWFFGSVPFAVIIGLILILYIYYYRALDAAYKNMVKVLRDQLAMEGKDKQFLLKRAIKLSEHLIQNENGIAGVRRNSSEFQSETDPYSYSRSDSNNLYSNEYNNSYEETNMN